MTEAQFIVGLENETAETLEETYRMARDWNPDMANWAMYTPWPFSDLFQSMRHLYASALNHRENAPVAPGIYGCTSRGQRVYCRPLFLI